MSHSFQGKCRAQRGDWGVLVKRLYPIDLASFLVSATSPARGRKEGEVPCVGGAMGVGRRHDT